MCMEWRNLEITGSELGSVSGIGDGREAILESFSSLLLAYLFYYTH